MQTWRRALMEIPEAQRLETALFWLEEMTGGEQDVAAVQKAYGVTPQVAQILATLSAASPRVVTRQSLYRALHPNDDEREMKTIDALVCRARQVVASGAIVTVWGVGYQMPAPLPPLDGLRAVASPYLPHRKSIGPGQREARA